jgi:phage shock protein C
MEEKKLRRSSDKMLAGVCAGVAEYFGIDPVIVRIVFVLLALAGGPGILLYIILWIVMPESPTSSIPPA